MGGQPGLARPTRPRDRDQPTAGEQGGDGVEGVGPPHEAGQLHRQVVGDVIECAGRPHPLGVAGTSRVGRPGRDHQLDNPLGGGEVAQPPAAVVVQRRARRHGRAEQLGRAARQQCLAAAGDGEQLLAAPLRRPRQAHRPGAVLTGVHGHADVVRRTVPAVAAVAGGEQAPQGHRRVHGLAGRGERRHQHTFAGRHPVPSRGLDGRPGGGSQAGVARRHRRRAGGVARRGAGIGGEERRGGPALGRCRPAGAGRGALGGHGRQSARPKAWPPGHPRRRHQGGGRPYHRERPGRPPSAPPDTWPAGRCPAADGGRTIASRRPDPRRRPRAEVPPHTGDPR